MALPKKQKTLSAKTKKFLMKIFSFTVHSSKKFYILRILGIKFTFTRTKRQTEVLALDYSNNIAQEKIYECLQSTKPCLIARWGTIEADVVNYYNNSTKEEVTFPENLQIAIKRNAGFFPNTNKEIAKFAKEHLKVASTIDFLAIRENDTYGEELEYLCTKAANSTAKTIPFEALCPLEQSTPWTKALEGKKILVIHPFEESIQRQFKIKDHLYNTFPLLPDFELQTIKAVQSVGDASLTCGYSSWFEALEAMCKQISEKEFDIALIGAGAYGMFLGAYCKSIGKKAVHIGGALQLFFGIKGRRWNLSPNFSELYYTDAWTHPLPEETPKESKDVEDACYW